ncbi:MAG: hypothetical protein KDI12_08525 [Anaerolineae bacterium]|nr:hypothetical protein [Anaerolineae bacterium]
MLKSLFSAASLAAVCLASTLPTTAFANDRHPCSEIPRDKARLACYDKAFGGPSPEMTAADRAAREAEAKENFGLGSKELQRRNPDLEQPVVIEGLESTVTKVELTPGRPQIITLANGQIWALTEGSIRGNLSVGDEVSVRKGSFGSHRLITPGGAGLRAKRVR